MDDDDDLFPDLKYEAEGRIERSFQAWHKPRKQFVRDLQWRLQIERLIDESFADQHTIRYLGLPGTDLLDIRHFYKTLCEPRQLNLCFLGFNSAAHPNSPEQTELNISLDEVRRLANIDPRSNVIPDDFCHLADNRSMAWDRAMSIGPYDVVNIDLCNGFARSQPGTPGRNYYNAVINLMTLQAGKRKPWLMFLTTRTGLDDINSDMLAALIELYDKSLVSCNLFQEKSRAEFEISNSEELMQKAHPPDEHLSIFLVALSKWMIGIGLGQQPPFKVSVKSTMGYRILSDAPHNDMISIAFRFDPTFIPVADPSGIASTVTNGPCEYQLASATVKPIKNLKCVDTILRGNSEVMTRMIESTAELLELARYDVSRYPQWLESA